MEKIICRIDWAEKNWCAGNDSVDGVIAVTDTTLEGVKKGFQEALDYDVECAAENGDYDVPEYLKTHEYEVVYEYTVAALLRLYQSVTSLKILSDATGISQRQLSFYMNGVRKPRPQAVEKNKEWHEEYCKSLHVFICSVNSFLLTFEL